MRSRRLLAILLAAVLVGGCDSERRPERASAPVPILRATFDAAYVDPVAVTGRGVVVEADHAVWRLDAAGARRRLFADPHLITTSASPAALAVVVSDAGLTLSGPYLGSVGDEENEDDGASAESAWVTSVRGGPLGGSLRELVRCRGDEAAAAALGPSPVVTGRAVAAVGCGGRDLVIAEGTRRQQVPAGGEVLALAAGGRTVGWVARATDTAPRVVTLLDLDDGARHVVGKLPAGTSGEAVTWLSMADDGRWRAAVQLPATADAGAPRCAVIEQAADASRSPTAREGSCETLFTLYTDDGSLETTLGDLTETVVRRDRDGRARGTLDRSSVYGAVARFATDGHRALVAVLPRCTDQLVLVGDVGRYREHRPASCPMRLAARRWPVAADGRVRVRVTCPRGCRAAAGDVLLSVGLGDGSGLNLRAARDLRVRPGRTGTLTFAGGARLRGDRATRASFSIRATAAFLQTGGTLVR